MTTDSSELRLNPALQEALRQASDVELWMDSSLSGAKLAEAQETIYDYLIGLVKQQSPDRALEEFKQLFFEPVAGKRSEASRALGLILRSQKELEFRNLFKRCCYILLNNWVGRRNYRIPQDLLQLISSSPLKVPPADRGTAQLREWINNFVRSADYEEIELFVSKYDENRDLTNWPSRYTSFLLAPQYVDERNPVEQRQAAQLLSKQLKEQFKFDLALYTARAQSQAFKEVNLQNPTIFGDEFLLLVKSIVARRGSMNYANLAKIFLEQTKDVNGKNFKKSLLIYLLYSEAETSLVKTLKTLLVPKIDSLYENYDEIQLNNSLLLMICNKVIRFLTLEKGQPSTIFKLLVTHDSPLTLAIMLLKLVLISPNSRTHLEVCLATLIQYYQRKPANRCQGFIKFLEICKIALTIYAENVEYNLVKMSDGSLGHQEGEDLESYRIFSLYKTSSRQKSQSV